MDEAVTRQTKAPAARAPWYRDPVFIPLVLLVLGIDQLSKYLVRANLAPGESFPAEGIFRITHVINRGSAFGLFPNQTVFLVLASLVGIAVLLLLYRNHPFPGVLLRLSLALQLGGAIGNLADRLRVGQVTDFIQLGWWPVFNLADASIMVGMAMLLAMFLMAKQGREGEAARQSSTPAPPGSGAIPGDDDDPRIYC